MSVYPYNSASKPVYRSSNGLAAPKMATSVRFGDSDSESSSEPVADSFDNIYNRAKNCWTIFQKNLGGLWTWPDQLGKHSAGHESSFELFDKLKYGITLVIADCQAAYVAMTKELEPNEDSEAAQKELTDLQKSARNKRLDVLIEYPALINTAKWGADDKISKMVTAVFRNIGELDGLQLNGTNWKEMRSELRKYQESINDK